MAHVKKSILIHAPVQQVYTVARDPKRWPTWYDGMGDIEKLTGDGGVGTIVEVSYTMAGMRFPVTLEVLEDHIGPEGARWSGKIEGPLASEATWAYVPKNGGTEVTTDIEYTVPGKALGKIANKLIIERTQERSLEQTQENLKMLCEAD